MHLDVAAYVRSAELSIQSAPAIYQSWLDTLANAVWDRDYQTVAAAMSYPGKMITEDAELEFETPAQMVEATRAFRDNLSQLRADAYHRICVTAWFVGPDSARIDGTHVTYIMSGGRYVIDPFMNKMTLVWRNARWLGGGLRSGVRNSSCLLLSPEQLAEKLRNKKRVTHAKT